MKLSGGALACSRPWIKFSSTGENGKKEKERKPKAAGKGRLEGIKSARSTQVTGGGLGRYGSAGVGTSRWGQYTMSHSHNASHFL